MSTKSTNLTVREHEVLRQLAKGKLNKEIAAELNIKEGKVKQHLNKIYSKYDFKNRVEASQAFQNETFTY